MNRQPFGTPPRWWAPKLSTRWVRLTRRYRRRKLLRQQELRDVVVHGLDQLKEAVDGGAGVLITPNHSAHYDSAALYMAADRLDLPLYMMAAWQVFAMSGRFESWAMQRLGIFSIDRESTDRQAFKQAVHILQNERFPLVIFPEGDIYHVNDRVTPFREGAAAIALSAAKRAERPIVVLPTGIKFFYLDDPTPQLARLLTELEERLYLRPQPELPLPDRVHRFAEAVLALKELDYVGNTSSGRLRDRVLALQEAVLTQLEARHGVKAEGTTPERVKVLRKCVIDKLEELQDGEITDEDREPRAVRPRANPRNDSDRIGPDADASRLIDGQDSMRQLQQDMEDVFFAIQCYSYPGDYLAEKPSIERLAETLDKFEEDVLGRELPSLRGRREVHIEFGQPIEITQGRGRDRVKELTTQMQDGVQGLLDGLNEHHPNRRQGAAKQST